MKPGWQEHCVECGRFVGADGDSYAPWGHSGMDEPPAPEFLCREHAERGYRDYLSGLLTHGIPTERRRPMWCPPQAWFRAKGTARAMFKHGYPRPARHEEARVEYDTLRAWFCACGRPERHPAHDRDEAIRLSVPHCKFERRVGRPLRPARARAWCVCGWNTGWMPSGELPFLHPIGAHLDEMYPERARQRGLVLT